MNLLWNVSSLSGYYIGSDGQIGENLPRLNTHFSSFRTPPPTSVGFWKDTSRQGRTCKGAQEHRVIICHNSLLVQVQSNMGHPHESHDEMCLCHLSGAWHDKHNTYRWKFATTIAERLFPNAPPSKPSTVPSRRKSSRKNGLHIFFLPLLRES